ncbi:alpha/beta fold hydrolase [Paracoccus sp. S-4012]|uniref:alpha/beta hydrolase n=1 Tax=Paracoccus sp. S-4012 TaxID=2665648 RepID=UPI0018A22943|nr:alpha/beta hydrolase [Paracoccus sp. S-4012]
MTGTEKGPVSTRLARGDVTLALHEWGAAQAGPPLVLLHATGFHGRIWDRVVAGLGQRRVIAVDQRGHGGSDAPPLTDWRDFADDLAAVLERLDLGDATVVGHSMGGAAALIAAAGRAAERIGRLILIDPVVPPIRHYREGINPMATPPGGTHPIARRRARFEDAAAMQAALGARVPYALFDRAVLRDYCTHGTRPAKDGGVTLACAPEWEARVYDTMLGFAHVHELLPQVGQPALVIRAMPPQTEADSRDFRFSPTDPDLAAALPYGRDLPLPQHTHFLPMEAPQFTAGLILAGEAALTP